MKDNKMLRINNFEAAKELVNFRVNPDGTLKKREGFRRICRFEEKPRGYLNVGNDTYLICGQTLVRYSEGVVTTLDTLNSLSFLDDDETVSMFFYDDRIYIVGGGDFIFYDIKYGYWGEVAGYAPIMKTGITSERTDTGEDFEDCNILGNNFRVLINPTHTTRTYYLVTECSQIISVYADGDYVTPDNYYLNNEYGRSYIVIYLDELLECEEIVVEATATNSFGNVSRYDLLRNVNTLLYSDSNGEHLLLWGGTLGANVMYSDFGYNETGKKQIDTIDYFRPEASFKLGDGSASVTDTAEFDEYTLMSTNDRIFTLSSRVSESSSGIKTTKFTANVMKSNLGVARKGSLAVYDEALYAVTSRGLFKIYRDKLYDGYSHKETVLGDINRHCSRKLTECKLYIHKSSGELWCYSKELLLVIDLKNGTDYLFDGAYPSEMIPLVLDSGFIENGDFCVFDEELTFDPDKSIIAKFVSKPIDFGNIFEKKDVYTAGAAFVNNGSRPILSLILSGSEGTFTSVTLQSDGERPSPEIIKSHARLGGTRYVTLELSIPDGSTVCEIRELMLEYDQRGD